MIPTAHELFNLDQTQFKELFDNIDHAWEVLPRIELYVDDHIQGRRAGTIHPTAVIDKRVDIGAGTVIGPHVVIQGPAIIGQECDIRAGAFLRGNVLIGDHCVIGNSTEIKNALLFNYAIVPHYNYIGDSILGYKAHFGGGAITSNYKADGSEIAVHDNETEIGTGMTKFGALVGDNAEIGCNVVLNPGTIIGAGTIVYPGTIIRGVVPANHIVKLRQEQHQVARR